jgi:hypothetical protein
MAPAAMAAGVDSLNVVAAAAIACQAFAAGPAIAQDCAGHRGLADAG